MRKTKVKIEKEKRMDAAIRNNKAITLIALIVTIIVLLILAGVIIATLTGENGILTRAQDAKNETEQTEKDEKINLARTEDLINEYINGIEVEQVTDENPGILETEGMDTYVINSIEDLVFFAYDVTNGNTYEGKSVKLGLSLDFNSTKSYVDALRTDYGEYGYDGELKTLLTSGEGFIPIGSMYHNTENYSFVGNFDGQNYKILNLYINREDEELPSNDIEYGLFSHNYGTIKNLELLKSNIIIKDIMAYVGNIVGYNYGKIENCISSGNILVEISTGGIRAGGISGCTSGTIIENCYNFTNITAKNNRGNSTNEVGGIVANNTNITCCGNYGKIYVENNGEKGSYVGGIVGTPGKLPVQECFNKGIIEVKSTEEIMVGGIIGYGLSATVNNCYNVEKITANSDKSIYMGGVAGYNANQSYTISNCYNIGNLYANSLISSVTLGEIVGHNYGSIVENCYYLENSGNNGVGSINGGTDNSMSIKDILSDELLEKLNNNQSSTIWKKGNSYLELYWE